MRNESNNLENNVIIDNDFREVLPSILYLIKERHIPSLDYEGSDMGLLIVCADKTDILRHNAVMPGEDMSKEQAEENLLQLIHDKAIDCYDGGLEEYFMTKYGLVTSIKEQAMFMRQFLRIQIIEEIDAELLGE